MKLQELIDSLESSSFKEKFHLHNNDIIVEKLKQMNSMVEMEDIKNSFVSQLLLIIMMKRRGCSPPFKKMHTVLSGPPGVGKTSMSILIAEIWDALNIMDRKCCKIDDSYDTITISEGKKELAEVISEIQDNITNIMITVDGKFSEESSDDIPDYIKTIYSRTQESSEMCQDIIDKYSKYFEQIEEEVKEETSGTNKPYVVAGRGDLIGTYQGHTSIKTEEFLKCNRGKVIILEEAYSLFNDERDSYGLEALTLINRYMDEHQDDYIFIFNGYGDRLENTIFRAQPGIKRRIQWTFDIKNYTWEGIYSIFVHQLTRYKKPTWKICPLSVEYYRKFFKSNYKYFPYFGGDTEKLILFIQLEYGKKYFECFDCVIEVLLIDDDLLNKGFQKYKELNAEMVNAIECNTRLDYYM